MSEQLPLLLAALAGAVVVALLAIFVVRKRRRAAAGLRALGFDSVRLAPLRATGSFSGMEVHLEHVTAFTEEDRDGDSFSYPVTRVRFTGTFAGRAIVRLPHWNAADRASTADLERVETGDSGFDAKWLLYVGDEGARAVWSDAATRGCLERVDLVLDLDMSPTEVAVTLTGRDPAPAKVEALIRLAGALQAPPG
jgi:hypothetical protein